MLNSLKWVLPAVAAFGMLVAWSGITARAADEAPAGASITGKVTDAEGKVVAEADVVLSKPFVRGQPRPEALATTKTDKDGKYELKIDKAKVVDGDYSVMCRVQDKGAARAAIKVKDGKPDPATADLKLAQRAGGGGGGGGGGGN